MTTMTMNMREAGALGYHALTVKYRLPHEQGMLDNVLADLRRGNIDHVLVKKRGGMAVWRRGTGRSASLPDGALNKGRMEDGEWKMEKLGEHRTVNIEHRTLKAGKVNLEARKAGSRERSIHRLRRLRRCGKI